MKRIALLFLAAVLTLTLTACETQGVPQEGETKTDLTTQTDTATQTDSQDNPFADMSYEAYFSEEREFNPLGRVHPVYDFTLRDGILFRGTWDLLDDPGVILYDKETVTNYDIVFDDVFFVTNGRTFHHMKTDGSGESTIFTLPDEMLGMVNSDIMWGSTDLIYFFIGNTVYRYHTGSGTLDRLYTLPEHYFAFRPLSNCRFAYSVSTQEWIDYIAAGGDEEASISFRAQNYYVYDARTGENREVEEYPHTYDELVGRKDTQ